MALLRALQGLLIVAVTAVAIALVIFGFLYYTNCPGSRLKGTFSDFQLEPIPYFWEPPEGCEAHTATRVILGNAGIMSDVVPRGRPGPPDPN